MNGHRRDDDRHVEHHHHIHLHLDAELSRPLLDFARKTFLNTERLITMSGTLSEQLAAAQAATSAALDGIATDVTEIAADVDQLLQNTQTGDPVTQAMVDSMTSIRDRAVAAKDGLDAVNAKVPPVTPAP